MTTKNISEKKIVKHNHLLSESINSNERKIFIKNNKKALICFEDFIKLNNCKSRNSKLSLRLLNLKTNSNIEKYQKNPILILKSYDKNIFNEKKRKFKSQTLGVDEGLITISKNDYEYEFNNIGLGLETTRYKNNFSLKNVEKENSHIKTPRNTNSNNLIYSAKSLSTNNHKLVKVCESERGQEFVKKKSIYIKRNIEEDFLLKMKKLKENFEQQLNYNFELKKLNNWDFLNLPRYSLINKNSKNQTKRKTIINFSNLNEEDASNMGWLLNIRNDKEKLRVISRIKQLNDFFIGFGKEQDAIFMQAMRMNKKGFNFDAFIKSKEELNDIKIDENEIISGVNYYREVMKVKTKREEMFKSEICACAEELRMAKIEKQHCILTSYELLNELDEINKKEIKILNELNNNTNNKLFYTSSFKEKRYLNYKNESRFNHFDVGKNSNTIINNFYSYREKLKVNNSDKKIFKKNKYFKLQMNNDMILKSLADLRKQKNNIEEKIKKNNQKINDVQIKHKKAKANYSEKVQLLSEYYYQILKKGIDVRKSGLSWVVVKLMELNSFIDKNHFPSFLSDSEINYLMRVGVKTYELNELVKLFQILKIRQKKLKERHIQEDRDKENKKKEENFNKLKEAHKGNKFNIGNDYVEYMEEIQRKYENVINVCLNEKTEENDINQITEKMKRQILSMQDDAFEEINNSKLYELYFIPGSLAEYFSKDKIFRQYFDDIYYLNEEINKRRKELKKEKENEYKKYRIKLNTNYFLKNVSGKEIIIKSRKIREKDKIMAALFGNDISV